MHFPKKQDFWSAALGHMNNDLFMSMGPVLLAFIGATYMPITPTQIGLAVSTRQFIGAITQPFFGWLSDRVSWRIFGAGGVAMTTIFLMSALALALTGNFWLMIIPFALSGAGSGAFHPVGTATASDSEPEYANSNTSYFFLLGQLGLAVGPALAGFLLDIFDSIYPLFFLGLATVPSIWFMSVGMPGRDAIAAKKKNDDPDVKKKREPIMGGSLTLLALMVALRGLAYPGSVAFIPVLFQMKGWSPAAYGAVTSIYWMSSAIAGVFFGQLADRYDRRLVLTLSLVLAVPVYFFLPASEGVMAFLLVMLAGGLIGGSHSVLVVLAQRLIPGSKSFASGASLGYIFGVGALGTLLIGLAADGFTLGPISTAGVGLFAAFQGISGFVLASALLSVFLPAGRGNDVTIPDAAPLTVVGVADVDGAD